LSVAKATPILNWSNPADILAGTPLGAAQLSAIATAPGIFTYAPAAGTVLGVGAGQVLTVAFTPTDAANYTTATASVRINVTAPSPPPDATPPTVTAFRTIKRKGSLGQIVVGFSEPMLPAGTLSLGAYRLVSAARDRRFGTRDDRVLALRSVAYDPTSRAVTLVTKGKVALNQPLQLVVRGSAGLVDLALNDLDGDRDGRPGGDYIGRFGTRPRA
jgi:hypothetical protein